MLPLDYKLMFSHFCESFIKLYANFFMKMDFLKNFCKHFLFNPWAISLHNLLPMTPTKPVIFTPDSTEMEREAKSGKSAEIFCLQA
jgi:hypothetical protein